MIAIVHSIYSQSVHAQALNAGLMDNDAERYCTRPFMWFTVNKRTSTPVYIYTLVYLLMSNVNVIDNTVHIHSN